MKWFNLIYLMITNLPILWKGMKTILMTLQGSQSVTEGISQASGIACQQSQKKVSLKAKATQVGGDHYKHFVIQPFEYCYKNNLNNLQSEAISYISRYRYKWENDKEKQVVDLQKAIHTLELLIEEING